ncbi:MAG: pyruvate kinase [Chthonomonas sp.]|nr:pyruvate kinase [Chthonomonas sp.]
MKRRTKIVCTLGPACGTPEGIQSLISTGMNVARINCSHGDWETRHEWIKTIRGLAKEIAPVGILVDLQGPKFRIGELEQPLTVSAGQTLTISNEDTNATLFIPGEDIWQAMKTGDRLLLGDGDVELKLGQNTRTEFTAKVVAGGIIKSRQGVTLVGKSFETPAITEKDLLDVIEAAAVRADFVALSYVRRAGDLRELRRILEKFDYYPQIVAKIETHQAVKEIDEILKVADVIMVARGDLGLQMDLEAIPLVQKKVIRKCNEAGKPVITATQMLESMINIARPTRAEATDVANAILDGTDAVMLSGETATGKYPIETLKVMGKIAEAAESSFNHDAHFDSLEAMKDNTSAVAQAAVQLSSSLKVKAIVTTTTSGLTPRMVSKYRPRMPILCASWTAKTHQQMSVIWGVESILLDSPETMDDVVQKAIDGFLRERMIKVGDTVVITAGVPAGKVGNTNLIMVENVK